MFFCFILWLGWKGLPMVWDFHLSSFFQHGGNSLLLSVRRDVDHDYFCENPFLVPFCLEFHDSNQNRSVHFQLFAQSGTAPTVNTESDGRGASSPVVQVHTDISSLCDMGTWSGSVCWSTLTSDIPFVAQSNKLWTGLGQEQRSW